MSQAYVPTTPGSLSFAELCLDAADGDRILALGLACDFMKQLRSQLVMRERKKLRDALRRRAVRPVG